VGDGSAPRPAPSLPFLTAHPVVRLLRDRSSVGRPVGYLLSLTPRPSSPRGAPAAPRPFRGAQALLKSVLTAGRSLDGWILLPWRVESRDQLVGLLSAVQEAGEGLDLAIPLRATAYLEGGVLAVHRAGLRAVAVGDPLLGRGHVQRMGLGEGDLVLIAPLQATPTPAYARELALLGAGGAGVIWPHLTRRGQVEAALAHGIAFGEGPILGTVPLPLGPVGLTGA
jgi:hypothetical protein